MTDLKVHLKYGDLEADFEGDPLEVKEQVMLWLDKVVPGMRLASTLFIEPDYKALSEKLSRVAKATMDGEIVLLEEADGLSMQLKILSALGLSKVLHVSGLRREESMTLDQLSSIVVSTPKSVSSRLSELRSMGLVEKVGGKPVRYKISLRGLLYLLEKL